MNFRISGTREVTGGHGRFEGTGDFEARKFFAREFSQQINVSSSAGEMTREIYGRFAGGPEILGRKFGVANSFYLWN